MSRQENVFRRMVTVYSYRNIANPATRLPYIKLYTARSPDTGLVWSPISQTIDTFWNNPSTLHIDRAVSLFWHSFRTTIRAIVIRRQESAQIIQIELQNEPPYYNQVNTITYHCSSYIINTCARDLCSLCTTTLIPTGSLQYETAGLLGSFV